MHEGREGIFYLKDLPMQGFHYSRQQKLQCEKISIIFKDGAYYCYCAYILPIARYLGFLWVVPSTTGIVIARLKTIRRKQNLPNAFGISKEN